MWIIIAIIIAIIGGTLKTIQMTLDEDLVEEIDKIVRKLGISRSAFARNAFRAAIGEIIEKKMEIKHQQGYIKEPVRSGEFNGWEKEQVWIEE
jgi:Arc/MetJ-type ribon-helix-helix transcriptional regulator